MRSIVLTDQKHFLASQGDINVATTSCIAPGEMKHLDRLIIQLLKTTLGIHQDIETDRVEEMIEWLVCPLTALQTS